MGIIINCKIGWLNKNDISAPFVILMHVVIAANKTYTHYKRL
jgi:hypothetical protein